MGQSIAISNQWSGESMSKESRWIHLFIGIWILAFHGVSVKAQCPRVTTVTTTVKETDPAGTEILTLPPAEGVAWSYSVTRYEELKDYLNFTKVGETYRLELTKPLDLEELRDKYQIYEAGFSLTFYCSVPMQADELNNILLTCEAVNEFTPQFNTSSINVYVKETASTGVTIVELDDWASDLDYNPITTEISGFSFIEPGNNLLEDPTVRGIVRNRLPLDYESLPEDKKYIEVGVRVKDTGDKTGTASLTIHVSNVDDLPPKFTYSGCPNPCSSVSYSATFSANSTGKLSGIKPAAIQAEDGDGLGASITYSITQGPNGYADYILMNPITAEVTILKPLHGFGETGLVLVFRAQENTDARLFTSNNLLISVQGVAAPIPFASVSSDKNDIVIVGAVLGITVFIILIILIVAMIYYRSRFRKIVHPHNEPREDQPIGEKGRKEDTTTPQVPSRPIILSDEEMKVDEEITTWLPANHLSDIVDLSDEDTLKMKKKNGMAPNSTTMNSRDSAFEESSDKKSGSGDSQREHDPDFDPVTEYAEVGMPNECTKDLHVKSSDHVYVPDPTTDQKGSTDTHNINDSGVEEAEYLTPNSTRVRLQNQGVAHNKGYRASGTDPDTSVYSDLISIDDDGINNARHDSQVGDGISSGAAAHVRTLERGNNFASSSPKPKSHRSKKSDKSSNPHQYLSDDTEITEYSTPRSERANRGMSNSTRRFNDEEVLSPNLSAVHDDDDDRPEVPPRPKIRELSGLKVKDSDKTNSKEVHYASVQKKASRKHKKESPEKDESPSGQNIADDYSKGGDGDTLDPPMRRKRHRKRSKHVKAPEEDIYDGTKDYEDLEMDPEFYLDTNKSRIKRSSRAPATHIDPDDTQYWITVTNDY